jgi:hypothetical protein
MNVSKSRKLGYQKRKVSDIKKKSLFKSKSENSILFSSIIG